jgi:hypothetical protein
MRFLKLIMHCTGADWSRGMLNYLPGVNLEEIITVIGLLGMLRACCVDQASHGDIEDVGLRLFAVEN